MTKDRRKHRRTKDENFLAYEFMDQDGTPVLRGMGKTINISKNGILIESHTCKNTTKLIKVIIEVGNELVEVNGNVTHVIKNPNGSCRLGVIFSWANKAAKRNFEYYIDALSVLKKNMCLCHKQAVNSL